jgi:hypothetical protein
MEGESTTDEAKSNKIWEKYKPDFLVSHCFLLHPRRILSSSALEKNSVSSSVGESGVWAIGMKLSTPQDD